MSPSDVRRPAPAWAGEKWVAPENLHLTLQFPGELDDDAAGRLDRICCPALSRLRPDEVEFTALAAVPDRTSLLRCSGRCPAATRPT